MEPASSVVTFPLDRARIYPVRSAELWTAVRETLSELGFRFDRQHLDDEHGVAFSRWTRSKSKTLTDLPVVGSSKRMDKLRVQMFVPQGFEPGRLYVSTVFETREVTRPGTRYVFHPTHVQNWFYEQVERRLGIDGRALPHDGNLLRDLELELAPWKEIPEACREVPLDVGYVLKDGASELARIRSPFRLESSYLEPLYPERARLGREEAVTVVSAIVRPDGWLSDLQLQLATSDEDEFKISAAQTVSFWRYTPMEVEGCPVPTMVVVNVRYQLY